MNRCIQCYRCVRFYRDTAGGTDFEVMGWHDNVYFGRHADGVLESEFSGNLVEVCPTGVFTDKTLKRHYARKWDLQTAPSVCVHCGLGCNTIPGERYGTLRRVQARYNGDVNGYFLCDRGRYGYEFVNAASRVRAPLVRNADGTLEKVSPEDALKRAVDIMSAGNAIGIGSPRASLESNFALRTLVGPERFYLGVAEKDARLLARIADLLRTGPARTPSLQEIGSCDAVLILGEDLNNVAPMVVLSLRRSILQKPSKVAKALKIPAWHDAAVREIVQDDKGPLYIATPDGTRLDSSATKTFRAAPDSIARLGFAVAHAIDAGAPPVQGVDPATAGLANEIAAALADAERPLVISGPSLGSESIIEAAANVAQALCTKGHAAALFLTAPECNSLGAALLSTVSLDAAADALANGAADSVIVLENDLCRRAGRSAVDALFAKAKHVIAIDHTSTATTARADVVLPAATFAESSGTFVNNEARAQRFIEVFAPAAPVQASWRWIGRLAAGVHGVIDPWPNLDTLLRHLARELPDLRAVADAAPHADFRIVGQKVPREAHRYSGRTAMTADLGVHEPQPPDDPDAPMSFSMEGFQGQPPSPLVPRFWAPGWNSVQAVTKFQSEVEGMLRGGNPGVRLFDGPRPKADRYFAHIPDAFSPRAAQFLVVPSYHIFGSEELSVLAQGVSQLVSAPYLAMNPADINSLGLAGHGRAVVSIAGASFELPLKHADALPIGVAALPAGLSGVAGVTLPAWATVSPVAASSKSAGGGR
jgi:NADH-quinone oxidoreductase subunit G